MCWSKRSRADPALHQSPGGFRPPFFVCGAAKLSTTLSLQYLIGSCSRAPLKLWTSVFSSRKSATCMGLNPVKLCTECAGTAGQQLRQSPNACGKQRACPFLMNRLVHSPGARFNAPGSVAKGLAILSSQQGCGQNLNNQRLIHRVSGFSRVVVVCPHHEPGYDPQACPEAKSLKNQDKIALFTKRAALYYDDQFERIR